MEDEGLMAFTSEGIREVTSSLRCLYGVGSVRQIESEWLAQMPAGALMGQAAEAVADEATRMLRTMPPEVDATRRE